MVMVPAFNGMVARCVLLTLHDATLKANEPLDPGVPCMKRSALVTAVASILLIAGCSVKNGFEIGPIKMTLPMGSGVLDPSQFPDTGELPLVVGTVRRELCDLPTEDQLTEVFRTAGSIDLAGMGALGQKYSFLALDSKFFGVSFWGSKSIRRYYPVGAMWVRRDSLRSML